MLMECRTNRYNNPYMVLLPAALQWWEEEKELWGSKTAAAGGIKLFEIFQVAIR